MSRHGASAVLAIVLFAVCGCQRVDYKERLLQAKPCCAQLSAVKYKPLSYDKPLTEELGGEQCPVRNFGDTRSFFLPVQLPVYQGPFEIQVRSAGGQDQLLVPSVLLLNQGFETVGRVGPEKFQYSNGHLSCNFFINHQERNVRYLVIYTGLDNLGKRFKAYTDEATTIPIYAGPVVFHYTLHNERKQTLQAAAGGQITVSAKKYAPRPIADEKE